MKKTIVFLTWLTICAAGPAAGQGFDADPVFKVRLVPDRAPLVAGDELRLAVTLTINRGWHVNSDDPGDEFSLPTTVEFILPDGWSAPVISFPDGEALEFEFSDTPIEVWEDRAVILAGLVVPETAEGDHRLRVAVTAQACNNTQCLPPEEVRTGVDVTVAPPGSSSEPANEELFKDVVARPSGSADYPGASDLG